MSLAPKDHAYPNGSAIPTGNASADGMTNGEKAVVGELVQQDEDKGAAVHVCLQFTCNSYDTKHSLSSGTSLTK